MNIIKQGKTNWKYLGIVISLALIATGAVFIYQRDMIQEMTSLLRFHEIKEQEETEDETADWKTYRNEEYGFEIKHPENYIVKEKTFTYTPLSEELLEQLQFTTCMKEFLREKDQFYVLSQIKISSPKEIQLDEVNVEVNIYNNPNNLTLNQWLDFWQNLYETHSACYKVETLPIFDRETLVVGGIEGVQGFSGCCGGCIKEIFFSENNKIYSLSLLGGTPGTLCYEDVCKDCDPCCFSVSGVKESIFTQMLSTFKFLGKEAKNCNEYEGLMSQEEMQNCTCPEGYEKFRGLGRAYCATNSQKPCTSHADCPEGEHCISDDGINWYCTGRYTGCYHDDPENPESMICAD